MTTAVRTPPHHDNLTCYTDYQCRLPACHQRFRNWDRDRYRKNAAGTWQPFTDAAPVRTHVHTLYAAGFTDYRIAGLAQTTPPTIHTLGKRSYDKGRGRQQRISQDLAGRILAIDPSTAMPGRIPTEGTRRRLQALVAAGWPMLRVAGIAGISPQNVSRFMRAPAVTAKTAQAVKDVYEELKDKKPERNGIDRVSAKKARKRAQRRRWAPPSYWDHPEHPIDDPDFRCEYGVTNAEILAEEAHWLMTTGGLTKAQAAVRLGKSTSYVDKALRDFPQDEQVAA